MGGGWMDRGTERHLSGWIDRWMDGWMDREMDEYTDRVG